MREQVAPVAEGVRRGSKHRPAVQLIRWQGQAAIYAMM